MLFERLPPCKGLQTMALWAYKRGRCIYIDLPRISAYLFWILCPLYASTLLRQPTRIELPFYLYLMCTDGGGSKLLRCGCGANESSEVELGEVTW